MLPLNYFLFIQIIFFLFITPGSPRVLIISYAMRYGMQKTLWTALGDIAANTVQMIVIVFGIGSLLLAYPQILLVMKWLGIIYLMYLAWELMQSHFKKLSIEGMSIDKKRFQKLAPKLHDLDIRFRCSISSVLVSDEYMELLYYAGCREVGIGFESADDEILELNNKAGHATTDMHRNAVKLIQKWGIQAKVYIITGLPGETDESIEAVKKL